MLDYSLTRPVTGSASEGVGGQGTTGCHNADVTVAQAVGRTIQCASKQ